MLIHIVCNHFARAAGKLFRYVCLFLMRFLNCLARNGRRKNVQFAMILPPCPSSMLILKRGSSRSALENVKKGGAWVSCFSQRVPRSDRFWKGARVRAQLWNPMLARFRPPHTPSAEHAPTPAYPRTPAHLLDINNPDCHLLGKKKKRTRILGQLEKKMIVFLHWSRHRSYEIALLDSTSQTTTS